jgi:hypothetical protein
MKEPGTRPKLRGYNGGEAVFTLGDFERER